MLRNGLASGNVFGIWPHSKSQTRKVLSLACWATARISRIYEKIIILQTCE